MKKNLFKLNLKINRQIKNIESKKAATGNKLEIFNDIKERADIIYTYRVSGYIDRKNAIYKLKELRINDNQVWELTTIKLLQYITPFVEASNEQNINELIMQLNILKCKLSSKSKKEYRRIFIK